ncbi:MAG: hypothetical protein QM756_41890 [Polyangiaceae bacterium]
MGGGDVADVHDRDRRRGTAGIEPESIRWISRLEPEISAPGPYHRHRQQGDQFQVAPLGGQRVRRGTLGEDLAVAQVLMPDAEFGHQRPLRMLAAGRPWWKSRQHWTGRPWIWLDTQDAQGAVGAGSITSLSIQPPPVPPGGDMERRVDAGHRVRPLPSRVRSAATNSSASPLHAGAARTSRTPASRARLADGGVHPRPWSRSWRISGRR